MNNPGLNYSTPPLAERMRPSTLDDLIGQEHLVGAGGIIRKAVQSGNIPSMILWGPPGVGKTTIANIIAHEVKRPFHTISAVSAGVKDVREIIEKAKYASRSILFIDEIHRFNKSQQDALLGAVEKGTITLIGATTENPSFEVNSALLSRMRVVTLRGLEEPELKALLLRALQDKERGLKGAFVARPEFLEHVAKHSSGDARRALSALEIAAARAKAERRDVLEVSDAEEALQ